MTDRSTPPRPWLASYGAAIPQDLPAPKYRSLADLVHRATPRAHGKRRAFTCVAPNGMNGTLTFDQVGQLSDAFAAFLHHECGVRAGDRVAVQLPNGLPYPIVAFGVFKAGAVLVNTNPLYTPSEMIHQFNDSGQRSLVIVDMFADKLAEVVPKPRSRRWCWPACPSSSQPARDHHPQRPEGLEPHPPPGPRLAGPVRLLRLKAALAKGRGHGTDPGAFWQGLGSRRSGHAAIHRRHDRRCQGRDADAWQHPEQPFPDAGGLRRADVADDCVLSALPLYHIFAFTREPDGLLRDRARNILIPPLAPSRTCSARSRTTRSPG